MQPEFVPRRREKDLFGNVPDEKLSGEIPAQIEAAANRGWKIFPILTRSRHTSLAELCIGQATCDPEQLLRWAAEHTNCNWAVATGAESGILVLELDRVLGQRTCRELMKNDSSEGDRMQQTLTVMAGMGEAAARYSFFRWPRCRRMRRLRLSFTPGVRLHGEDEYVLIPPSMRTNGERYVYVDPEADPLAAPSWLLSLAFEPEDGDG